MKKSKMKTPKGSSSRKLGKGGVAMAPDEAPVFAGKKVQNQADVRLGKLSK